MFNYCKIICKASIKFLLNEFLKIKYSNKVQFGVHVKIDQNCYFEGDNAIGANTSLKRCTIGKGTYISENVSLKNLSIGKYCSIGSNIRNIAGRHPTSDFVSTHPSFFSIGKRAGFTFVKEQKFEEIHRLDNGRVVEIGNDVWIGDNVTFLDGIKVGDGAIIGANTFVLKNIEPYSINVGVPSKLVKYRFSKDQISFLIDFKWWNKEEEWIKEHADLFSDISVFISSIRTDGIQ